jgi:uncharacterized Ntn-hydrolase superfamily protein
MFGARLLDQGMVADAVLGAMRRNDAYPEHRQIGVIDREGRVAANTGTAALAYAGHQVGENYIVLGNVVASEKVIEGMKRGFENSKSLPLCERLLRGIEAGRDAGGQLEGQRSAFIKLLDPSEEHLALDLRVDLHEEPVGALRLAYERALLMDARLAEVLGMKVVPLNSMT